MPEAERERDEERARDRERTNSEHPALLIPIRAENKQQSTIRPHTLNPKTDVFLGSLCRDNGLFLPVLLSASLCRHPELLGAQLLGALRMFNGSGGKPKKGEEGKFLVSGAAAFCVFNSHRLFPVKAAMVGRTKSSKLAAAPNGFPERQIIGMPL